MPTHLRRLTSLRAFAALAVFAYHLHLPGAPGRVSQYGYTGVAFFFVLSGFVLTWSAKSELPRARFYLRRFARIWPSHFVTWLLAFFSAQTAVATTLVGSLASLLLVQAWWPSASVILSNNGVSWSLSCEVAFYAALPLILPALLRARPARRWQLAIGYAVVAGVVVLACARQGGDWLNIGYYNPLLRFSEFLLGVVAALELKRGWRLRPLLTAACVVLGAALFVVGPRVQPGPDVAATVLCFALVVSAAQRDLAGADGWLTSGVMLYAGKISFAFYLVHGLVGAEVYDRWGLRGVVGDVTQLLVAVVAAIALHHLIERPCEARLRTLRLRDGHPVAPTPFPVDG